MCSDVRILTRRCVNLQFVLLSVVIVWATIPVSALPLSEFYPFNTTDDKLTERDDDGGSPPINLSINFPYFKQEHTQVYVNNNGLLSFNERITTYKPQAFPLKEHIALIAPFWADVDINRVGGWVWYRPSTKNNEISRVTKEIRDFFDVPKNFRAKWMFVATWDRVGFYGASGKGVDKRNTFQCVLVTDGERSFAIFNYYQLQWTTGSNSGGGTTTGTGGTPAQAGFNAGDTVNYSSVESSQTEAVINLTLTSNVGIPGKWIFRVDDIVETITCNDSAPLRVSPRQGIMLGGQEISLTGPCFDPVLNVAVRVKETNVNLTCNVTNTLKARCITNLMFITGEVTLEADTNGAGWRYSATFTSLNVASSRPMVIREKPDSWFMQQTIRISALQLPSKCRVQVLGYKVENDVPQLENVWMQEVTNTNARKNDLSFQWDIGNSEAFSSAIIRLTDTSDPLGPSNWSDLFPVRQILKDSKTKSRDWCSGWLERQSNLSSVTDTGSCPCTLQQARQDRARYHPDPLCNSDKDRWNSEINCVYNPSASHCVRRNIRSPTDDGVQCCYDAEGELLDARSSPSGGTHHRYNYKAQGHKIVPYFSYFEDDLLPSLHCCQYSDRSDLCRRFLQYRPVATCQNYNPPSPAQAAGDPHIVTLDGKGYTFNGVGDFVLVEDDNSSVVIQVRAVKAVDEQENAQNASVFSEIVLSVPNVTDTVVVRRGQGREVAEILVNGDAGATSKDTSTSQFKGVTVYTNYSSPESPNIVVVLEPVSVSVSIDVTRDVLNVLTIIGADELKGRLRGLLGNYNGNPSDDFLTRNGTVLPENSTMKDIHYGFGESWRVSTEQSLFSQPKPAVIYTPAFIDTLNASELRNGTLDICGMNKLCWFDYDVTGNEQLSRDTLKFSEKFNSLVEDMKRVVRCPYVTTPESANMTGEGFTIGSNRTFSCYEDFEKLSGSDHRYCQEDGTWDGDGIVCAKKKEKNEHISEYVWISIGAGCGAGVFAIVLVVFITCYMYKRKRRKVDSEGSDPSEMNPSIFIAFDDIHIPGPVFENAHFIESLNRLNEPGPFKIPRPKYVDPNIYGEYFF